MSRRLIDVVRPNVAQSGAPETVSENARRELHRDLVASLDINTLTRTSPDALRSVLRTRLFAMVEARGLPMSIEERNATVESILD